MTTLAFLGGTGDQGRGLARRLALAGHSILLGSRAADRAAAAADSVLASLPDGASVRGLANAEAAGEAEVVVVAVPYDGHAALLGDV
ncbi:MAG TPA: NAD(P)-binding domain-containing protein, partial [Mycobacteriales bacterium]|nr:NAD(P)-binding domain-containing protein [Mycobacteriales bacterium]